MTTEFSYKNLPPVGLVCEVQLNDGHGYTECEIIAHYDPCRDGDLVAVFAVKSRGGRVVHQRVGHCFRPIITAEQIAEENQRMAIQKMLAEFEHTGSLTSFYEVCECLYKAGYRKFEIVEEDV